MYGQEIIKIIVIWQINACFLDRITVGLFDNISYTVSKKTDGNDPKM